MKKRFKLLLIVLSALGLISILGFNIAKHYIISKVIWYIETRLDMIERTESFDAQSVDIDESVNQQKAQYRVLNVALLGIDQPKESTTNGRSDAVKVVSLNFNQQEMTLSSIQRDILIWVPEPLEDWDKLNHAHWYGGPELTLKTLNYNFDLDVKHYVSFNFSSLKEIIDSIGGVDIYLNSAEANVLNMKAQQVNRLNGEQALNYARIRKIDSDYERMERQTKLIEAVLKQLKTKSLKDVMTYIDIWLPLIETNLTNTEIKGIIEELLKFDELEYQSIQLPNGTHETDTKSYKGYSPLYLVKNYQQMVVNLHEIIYGDNAYQLSDRLMIKQIQTYEKFEE